MQDVKTLLEDIEDRIVKVQEEMCDNYCRMPKEYCSGDKFSELPDGEKMYLLEEICDKCPLGKLL